MRALFTTLPGYGGLHPLVPQARALQAAGHEVAFACARSFSSAVEARGFRCFPAGLDWHTDRRDAVYANVRDQLRILGDAFSPLHDVFARFLPMRMIPDLLALAESWPPDVIVRDPLEFGGCVAAEVLGTPHVACGPLFAFWEGVWHAPPPRIPNLSLDEVRGAYGLSPDPELTMLHRWAYLAFLPPSFPDPGLMIPRTVHWLRPGHVAHPDGEALPEWRGTLPPLPTIHASLGTVFHRMPGVFEAILEALRDEPVTLILAVGNDRDPADFGPQPPNVIIERYLPHSLLLPRCDLAISHAGFSSVMACLLEGVPMVLMPLAGNDQPGNAERCAALGAGRVIPRQTYGRAVLGYGGAPHPAGEDAGPRDQSAPLAIRTAVREVLHDPRYRERAQRLREKLRKLPGPEHGVALLERLVREKEPLLTTNRRESAVLDRTAS